MANSKIAIIGRPNVGKSTLFNRLIQKRVSITSEIQGTTRDRIIHEVNWLGKKFDLIDTGGYSDRSEDMFQIAINQQVEIALEQADSIVFLVSFKDGMSREDLIIAKKLRQSQKPLILAINKVDNLEMSYQIDEFRKLGIATQIPLSSIHGIGVSALLDAMIASVSNLKSTINDDYKRIGIIGKPNVGKSTILNTLLRDNRVIVSDKAGTTRDAIDTLIKYHQQEYIFTDTAGIKRNKDSLSDIEWYSELRTNQTIFNSDIVLLMLDPTQGLTRIDEKILSVLKEEYKPTIILINKMDLLTSDELNAFLATVKEEFKFFNDPYIINVSALQNKKVNKIFDAIDSIFASLNQEISISSLNNFLIDVQMIKKPPRHNGLNVKLSYVTYSNNKYPHFIFFSNYPRYVHFSYQRFLENNIKRALNFKGVPIKMSFRKK